MSHEVGDILWVVGKERPGVRVYRVVEEVIKKSLEGTITSYRVQPPGGTKVISLEKIDGTIYGNVSEARDAMMSHAEKAIGKMIGQNQALVSKHWKPTNPETKAKNLNRSGKKLAPIPEIMAGENFIELPDGTKAKINMPNIEDIL